MVHIINISISISISIMTLMKPVVLHSLSSLVWGSGRSTSPLPHAAPYHPTWISSCTCHTVIFDICDISYMYNMQPYIFPPEYQTLDNIYIYDTLSGWGPRPKVIYLIYVIRTIYTICVQCIRYVYNIYDMCTMYKICVQYIRYVYNV